MPFHGLCLLKQQELQLSKTKQKYVLFIQYPNQDQDRMAMTDELNMQSSGLKL